MAEIQYGSYIERAAVCSLGEDELATTISGIELLTVLFTDGAQTEADISIELGIDFVALGPVLEALESANLTERISDAKGSTSSLLIGLTARGKRVADELLRSKAP